MHRFNFNNICVIITKMDKQRVSLVSLAVIEAIVVDGGHRACPLSPIEIEKIGSSGIHQRVEYAKDPSRDICSKD